VLDRLAREGRVMLYDASVVVYHERRDSLRGFTSQMRKYGRGRGQLIARRPSTTRLAFLAPSALVFYLAALPAEVVLVGPVMAIPALLYAGWITVGGLKVATTFRRFRVWPLASALIAIMHLNYGLGVLWGCAERRRRSPAHRPDWVEV
jgi:hypothetical protein